MNIFGIGLPEMGLIMVVALLVFGPKKLPEIGRSLGKAMKGFQDASKEFENEFKKEADRLEKTVAEPMKATLEKPRAIAPDKANAGKADEPTEAEVITETLTETVAKTAAEPAAETVEETAVVDEARSA